MFISFIIGIVNIIGDENYQLKYLLYFYTLKWFVYKICQITLMIFFLYQGIGLNVIKKSFLISILWSLITTIIIISLIGMNFNDEEYDNLDNIIISYIVFISVISIFQIIVWLSPQKSLYRRPAAIFIAQAFLLVNIISFILLVSIFATEENKNFLEKPQSKQENSKKEKYRRLRLRMFDQMEDTEQNKHALNTYLMSHT
jgi:hypothetical protein